ncbi:MAG: DNA-binding protein [Alphaproteobacteria bacterium]|jgi:transcriptional regulator with XRE-family HTH domain|nr:DNA-binding protein [Alphaproteobacteria bacterium]
MALFFDQAWFDAQLKAVGATRDEVAKQLKLSSEQVAELWKDQRELRAAEVAALARLLHVGAAEVAKRAGISTPVPEESSDVSQRLSEMNERLTRIERMIVELKTLILTPRS